MSEIWMAARRGSVARGFAALALVALLVGAAGAAPARADEEMSSKASELVTQSISLIINGAEQERVVEQIQAAVDAPDTKGVDLAKVKAALDAAEGGSGEAALSRARVLLQESVGARPASGYGTVPRIGETSDGAPRLATGGETGTTVILEDARPARGVSDGGDVALLLLALGGLAVGLFLSYRFRPAHSIQALRRGDVPTKVAQ